MKIGLKVKVLVFMIVVPVTLMGILFVVLFSLTYQKDFIKAQEFIKTEAADLSKDLHLEISRGFEMLRSLAANPVSARVLAQMGQVPQGLDNDDYLQLKEFKELREVLAATPANTTVDLVYGASPDSSGLVLGRDLQMISGFDVRTRDYFKSALANPDTPVISAPRISAEKSDVPVIVITAAQTVRSRDGKVVGVLAFNYRLNRLIDIVKREKEVRGVDLSLWDAAQKVVLWNQFPDMEYFFTPEEPLGIDILLESQGLPKEVQTAVIDAMTSQPFFYFDGKNAQGDILVQTVKVPGTRWGVSLTYPKFYLVSEVIASILPPMVLFFLIYMAIQGVVFFISTRVVVGPLVGLASNLKNLAESDADLRVRVVSKSRDEIGAVAQSFNVFVEKLQQLMIQIKVLIEDTDKVKGDVSASIEETSAAIEEITANLESINKQIEILDRNIVETVTAIEEITSNIGSVDQQIFSQSAMVEQSTAAITEMMASLNNVSQVASHKKTTTTLLAQVAQEGRTSIEDTSVTFQSLEKHIAEVQEMADAINAIASQTNLLSMNAAIEAAHAGEAGKGFAVVAEEIRKLADSAGQSSKAITKMLKDITESVGATSRSLGDTSGAFEKITKEVGETVAAFAEIEQSVTELNLGGRQILEATHQINEVTAHIRTGSGEIKSGTEVLLVSSSVIKQVSDRVTTGMAESTSGAQEIVRSMQNMVGMTQELQRIVGDLKKQFGRFRT